MPELGGELWGENGKILEQQFLKCGGEKVLQIKFHEKMPKKVNEQNLFTSIWRVKVIGVRGGFKRIQT